MAYLGNKPATSFTKATKDTFSGDGSTTAFTLSKIATTNDVEVFVENVQQEPTSAYGISGTTLTFTAAPPSGTSNVYVIHRSPAIQTVTHPSNQNLQAASGTFTGGLTVDKDGATVATFDRATSDGSIVNLQKDGTTVGSIASDSNGRVIYNSENNAGYIGVNGTRRYYWTGTDLSPMTDGGPDLGASSFRFKDLYLSGGVYLGGTGAANYLDDYEEGTFTATVEGSTVAGSATYQNQSGHYTKVGNRVFVSFALQWTGHTGTGSLRLSNLPFTGVGGVVNVGACMTNDIDWPDSTDVSVSLYLNGTDYCRPFVSGHAQPWQAVNMDAAGSVFGSINYKVS